MTVGEVVEMLSAVDPDLVLVFTLDRGLFVSPCPFECGILELGPASPYVSGTGELVAEEMPEEMPTRMYALFPHDPNNPHDEYGHSDEEL